MTQFRVRLHSIACVYAPRLSQVCHREGSKSVKVPHETNNAEQKRNPGDGTDLLQGTLVARLGA